MNSITNLIKKKIATKYRGGSDGKESICDSGDLGSMPALVWSPGGETGYSPQGCKESDTIEQLTLSFFTEILTLLLAKDHIAYKCSIRAQILDLGFSYNINFYI